MLKLKIEGMNCGHCSARVKSVLSKVPGVEGPVDVDLKNREAVIPGSPDPKAAIAAVEKEGYQASLAE